MPYYNRESIESWLRLGPWGLDSKLEVLEAFQRYSWAAAYPSLENWRNQNQSLQNSLDLIFNDCQVKVIYSQASIPYSPLFHDKSQHMMEMLEFKILPAKMSLRDLLRFQLKVFGQEICVTSGRGTGSHDLDSTNERWFTSDKLWEKVVEVAAGNIEALLIQNSECLPFYESLREKHEETDLRFAFQAKVQFGRFESYQKQEKIVEEIQEECMKFLDNTYSLWKFLYQEKQEFKVNKLDSQGGKEFGFDMNERGVPFLGSETTFF